jgi:hypothetical protein
LVAVDAGTLGGKAQNQAMAQGGWGDSLYIFKGDIKAPCE